MRNYKMLCLDIYGTLLNSEHQITKETKEAIRLYKDDSWIVEKSDTWSDIESSIVGFDPELNKFSNVFDVNDNKGPNKILILGDKDENLKVSNILKEKFKDYINIYPSKPTYLEIMNKDVCKTEAIIQLLKLLDIKRSEVIAIGDNYNDIDIDKFRRCWHSNGKCTRRSKENK